MTPNPVEFIIRTTLTTEGIALVQVKLGESIINFTPDAIINVAHNMLGAAYGARAEEAVYKATHDHGLETTKKAIEHLRVVK